MSNLESKSRARYVANCHCGAIKIAFELNEPLEAKPVTICNCSICRINGYINVYTPGDLATFVRGREVLKAYSYAPHSRGHFFCAKCGTSILNIPRDSTAEGGLIGINIRTVFGVDLDKLTYRKVDGWSREPKYKPPN